MSNEIANPGDVRLDADTGLPAFINQNTLSVPTSTRTGNNETASKAAQLLGTSDEVVQQRVEDNAGLLRDLEGTINEIMGSLSENDLLIEKITKALGVLQENLKECQENITRLRENLRTDVPESVRTDYESQINSLKQERDETKRLIMLLSNKMGDVNRKVKAQSNALRAISSGGSATDKTPQKSIKKIKSMKRAELDTLAKKWGVDPKQYPKKQDIVNALQLLSYAKMFNLEKLPKWQLVVVAKNFGTMAKTKKDLLLKLNKKLGNVSYV